MPEMVDLGGYRLAAEVSGLATGPWIVLIHGLGLTRAMWEPQLPLLERHRRVLRYDSRGLGASDVPPGPYELAGLVGDAVALMDHFAIERADVMGLSLGGRTAMGVGLDHGDRVSRLIVADTRADTPPDYAANWDRVVAQAKAEGLAANWRDFVGRWFTNETIGSKADIVARFERDYVATSLEGYLACIAALKQTDFLRRLGSLAVPTLFIGGAEDTAAPPELMRAMAAATPGATYVELPHASHLANVDNPEGFNAEVGKFLGLE